MNRLKELRKDNNFTLTSLSKALEKNGIKITADSLSKYERGDREPKLDTWKDLANFFDVSVQFIQGLTYSKDQVLRLLNSVYIEKKLFKDGEGIRLVISLKQNINNYLIINKTKFQLNKFSKKELNEFSINVKKYWNDNFDFLFNEYRISSLMNYGSSERELIEALNEVIRKHYLSESKTVISMDFDSIVADKLKDFELSKDELLRFGTKKQINKSISNLIGKLKYFQNSLNILPENKPKPSGDEPF